MQHHRRCIIIIIIIIIVGIIIIIIITLSTFISIFRYDSSLIYGHIGTAMALISAAFVKVRGLILWSPLEFNLIATPVPVMFYMPIDGLNLFDIINRKIVFLYRSLYAQGQCCIGESARYVYIRIDKRLQPTTMLYIAVFLSGVF